MKLSNKILIGFFGFCFLYMVVAFTEMRLKGDLNRLDDSNSISESVEIKGIKYIVFDEVEQRLTVRGSVTSGIEVNSISGDLIKHIKYDFSGDTLTIRSIDSLEDRTVNISIHVTQSNFIGLKSINTGVIISDLNQETLDIHQNDGWIRMTESNKIGKLNLIAQNSAYFNFLKGEIDTLNTTIDFSEVSVPQPMKLVKGSMANKSYLYLDGASEIQFKKDEGSKLILN